MITVLDAVGFALSPVQKRDFQLLGGHWTLFVRIIARQFASQGLIPADHPTVTLGKGGITGALSAATKGYASRWGDTLAKGWNDGAGEGPVGRIGGVLVAIVEGGPAMVAQTLSLAATWAMLATIVLGLVSAGALLLISTAHAAATTATAAASSNDLARKMLGDMLSFLPGASSSNQLAQAVGQMAAIMGWVAFTLAGVGAIWCACLMMIEFTWNPDSAKGRYVPWMVAMRVAVAIGMLVPINNGWGAGQIIVGQMAAWGSDKASMAWSQAVGFLSSPNRWASSPGVSKADAIRFIESVFYSESCMAIFNSNPDHIAQAFQVVPSRTVGGAGLSTTVANISYDLKTTNSLYGGLAAFNTMQAKQCGEVVYPSSTAATADVLAAQRAAADAAISAVRSYASTAFAQAWSQINPNAPAPGSYFSPGVVGSAIDTYYNGLRTQVAASFDASKNQNTSNLQDQASNQGWVGAGAWLVSISRLQGQLAEAGAAIPTTTAALSYPQDPRTDSLLGEAYRMISADVNAYRQYNSIGDNSASGTAAAFGNASDGLLDPAIFAVSGADPIAQVSSLGYRFYYIGAGIWAAAAALSNNRAGDLVSAAGTAVGNLGGGSVVGMAGKVVSGLSSIANSIPPLLTGIAAVLVITGFALAYMVPALPLIRFMFSVLQWLINVVEVVILAPLMMVLMVTADTGGFIGPAAKAGFWLIIGAIVRPILTIMGFVIGIVMISVMVSVVNTLFFPWVQDFASTGRFTGLGPIGFVAFSIIYLGVVYGIVNSISKLPETLPNAAHRWIGANAGGERDDGAAISNVASNIVNRLRGPGMPVKA